MCRLPAPWCHTLPEPTLAPQMLPSGQDERVGGNTPDIDMEDNLLEGAMLGHSSASDAFFTNNMLSLEGEHTAHIFYRGCTLQLVHTVTLRSHLALKCFAPADTAAHHDQAGGVWIPSSVPMACTLDNR